MALPSSGQISWSDIRSETLTTGRTDYSIAKAAWTSGSSNIVEYPAINLSSFNRPNASQPAAASEWYSYDHTYGAGCPATISDFGNRSYPITPYSEMWVVDLGTISGQIDYTISIATSSIYTAQIDCDYGYPYDSTGQYVGGLGGTMFSTGLINSGLTGSFTYNYSSLVGTKVYVTIGAIQSSTGWPRFNMTMSCAVPLPTFSNHVSFLENTSAAACAASPSIYIWGYNSGLNNGDTYYVGNIIGPTQPLATVAGGNLYYSNGTNWIQINGSGVAISAGACPTPTPTPTITATPTVTPTLTPTGTPTPTPFCNQCRNWEYMNVPIGGDVIYYYSCADGSSQTIAVGDGQTGSFCNCDTTGTPTTDNGTQLTQVGSC